MRCPSRSPGERSRAGAGTGERRSRPGTGGVEQVGTGGDGRGAGACPEEDARGAGALGMEVGMEVVTGRAGPGAVSR